MDTIDFSQDEQQALPAFLHAAGDMGRRIASFPWQEHVLGELDRWPQSLKTAVSLILNSTHPMWIGWGADMTFLYNDAYVHVLGREKHRWALGQPAMDVWSEIWDVCGPLADKVFRRGEASFVDDVRLFMSRGERLEETYYSFSYSPIRDESGEVGGLFCPSTDVTAKVIGARRLRTLSELAANALAQTSADAAGASAAATLAKNPDDVPFAVLYLVDGDVAELTQSVGVAAGEALAPPFVPLGTHLAASPLREIAQVVAHGRSRRLDISSFVTPAAAAGQPVHDALVLPVATGSGRAVGALLVGLNPSRALDAEHEAFFDLVATNIGTAIANARAAEDEKRRADVLAEMDRAKTVFFSNVSHEFRTPLTLMLAPLEDLIARQNHDLPSSALDLLQLAHRNGLRLQRLVNTLLDFSRLEAGRTQATFLPTDVATLTADLASNFRSACEAAGLRLIVDAPPLAEPVYVDRIMWEKIVLNLLSNAFKFTFSGEIAVRVAVDADALLLSVRDTGVGIPAHELPHLFERFHRVQGQRSRSHEGSGIGLALVYELVHLHGGTIGVESAPDQGTTMLVRVPRGTGHLDPAHVDVARRDAAPTTAVAQFLADIASTIDGVAPSFVAPSPTVRPDGARILVVDDNRDLREYVARVLAAEHDVTTAQNGREALERARDGAFDLVVTDVMMPELDGFGLLSALRADERLGTTPVIMLSARAGEESAVEGLDRGADDYLAKPFSASELVARVNAQIAAARARSEQLSRELRAGDWFSRPGEETISGTSFRAIADQLPFIVWLRDADGNLTFVNETYSRVTGIARDGDPLPPAVWESCIHPDDRERVRATLREAVASHGLYEVELRMKRIDEGPESYRWFHSQSLPQFRDGRFHGWLGSATDINAQREVLQRTRHIAQTLQEGLLPARLPQTPQYRIDAVYQAAERDALIGGDWFDVVELPGGGLLLSVGDVTGHGVAASTIAGRLHHAIVDYAFVDPDPAAILAATNRVLAAGHPDVFATALVAIVDAACTQLRYASAGHPPPLFAAPGVPAHELPDGGLPLGVMPELDVPVHRLALPAGAVLALFTDGLVEFNRDIASATARLANAVTDLVGREIPRSAAHVRDTVLDSAATVDDAALLIARFGPFDVPAAERHWTCDARDRAAIHACRLEIASYLRRFANDDEDLFASELVLGELLANTVEHAPGPIDVELGWTGEHPVLAVHDEGAGIDTLVPALPEPSSEKGRGLFLVAALAHDMQAGRSVRGGTTIRATLPARRASF